MSNTIDLTAPESRAALNGLLPALSAEDFAKRREELIASGYEECSFGDGRLVNPNFVRDIPGLGRIAVCPDRFGNHRAKLGPTRYEIVIQAWRAAAPRDDSRPTSRSRRPSAAPAAEVVELDAPEA